MVSPLFPSQDVDALVRLAQEGSTDAFGKLYDHYFDQIYRYASFRLSAEITEDIVADVFVKAWEKLHTYTPQKGATFGSWLFRIARHLVIDTYRNSIGITEEVPEEFPDADELNKAETHVKREYLLATIRRAMRSLPTRYQDVLQLSYIAELPHSEIARVTRMREGSVRILKHRALKKLETLLPPDIS